MAKILNYLRGGSPGAFCVRLVVLLGLLTALTLAAPFKALIENPLIALNAWLSHWILDLMGEEVSRDGNFVRAREFSFEVVSGCTGLFVFLFLLSAVVAFPSSWGRRLRAIAIGAALIFVLNQLRIVSLFYVGRHYFEYFKHVHVFFWQSVIIVVTALYWYSWAARTDAGAAPDEAAGA